MCFQINSKSSHADQCVKSRILNKSIDYILSIDTFEQKCVMIKAMLQSPHLEYHINTIGIDQSLCTRSSFEHKFLNNIKNIYQHANKYYSNIREGHFCTTVGFMSFVKSLQEKKFIKKSGITLPQ